MGLFIHVVCTVNVNPLDLDIVVCLTNWSGTWGYQIASKTSIVVVKLVIMTFLWSNMYSKTAPWLPPIHKEGNKLYFIYLLIYDCTTFTSRVNVLNENTIRTEGIQITLNFIMSSISLVSFCENVVSINSIVIMGNRNKHSMLAIRF